MFAFLFPVLVEMFEDCILRLLVILELVGLQFLLQLRREESSALLDNYVLENQCQERLLNHLRKRSVETEVVKRMVLRLLIVAHVILLLEGLVTLLHCIQIHIY